MAKISSYVQSGLCPRPNVRLYDVHRGEVSPHRGEGTPAPSRARSNAHPGVSPAPLALQPRLLSAQNLDIGAELVRLGYAVPTPQEEGAAGDSPPRLDEEPAAETPVSRHGTAASGLSCHALSPEGASPGAAGKLLTRLFPAQENGACTSLESLVSEPRRSPGETPPACVSLAGKAPRAGDANGACARLLR